jgi:hypothetical protein
MGNLEKSMLGIFSANCMGKTEKCLSESGPRFVECPSHGLDLPVILAPILQVNLATAQATVSRTGRIIMVQERLTRFQLPGFHLPLNFGTGEGLFRTALDATDPEEGWTQSVMSSKRSRYPIETDISNIRLLPTPLREFTNAAFDESIDGQTRLARKGALISIFRRST